jgi:plastocyanin
MRIRIRQIKIIFFAAALGTFAVVLDGCTNVTPTANGGDTHAAKHIDEKQTIQPDQQTANGEVVVVIQDFVFKPAELTVSPGTRVTWINKDEAPHTATSVDKKFNSGGMDTDDKFSFVFTDKGEYPYFCALHPQMKATVTVK